MSNSVLSRRACTLMLRNVVLIGLASVACQEPAAAPTLAAREQASSLTSLHVSIETPTSLSPQAIQALSAALENQSRAQNVMVQVHKDESGRDRVEIDLLQTASTPAALQATVAALGAEFANAKVTIDTLAGLGPSDIDSAMHEAVHDADPARAKAKAEALLKSRGQQGEVIISGSGAERRIEIKVKEQHGP